MLPYKLYLNSAQCYNHLKVKHGSSIISYDRQRNTILFYLADEKRLVDEVFQNAMQVLSEEDRALPQVENVLPLLKRGIGIHHGGEHHFKLLTLLQYKSKILSSSEFYRNC
jgi:hypothetical protein